MDTIFVKSVREHSPAYDAGLATGDRIIGVNGRSVFGHSYQRVVQWIQQSGAFLQLLVVPKEDDILQLYFGETAHNPETNQRPRLRSPDAFERRAAMLQQQQQQQQQAAAAAAAAAAARLAQPGSRSSLPGPAPGAAPDPGAWGDPRAIAPAHAPQDRTWLRPQARRSSEGAGPPRGRDGGVFLFPEAMAAAPQQPPSSERALWAGASAFRPLGAQPGPGPAPAPAADAPAQSAPPLAASSRSLQAFFYPGAAAGCRRSLDAAAAARRESTVSLPAAAAAAAAAATPGGAGVGGLAMAPAGDALSAHGSLPACASAASASSDAGSKDSLLSFDSAASTLTGRDGCSSEDSLIISRIRKSFEQKEEFLRRPNQPIAWNLPEGAAAAAAAAAAAGAGAAHGPPAVIAREFYARPQKLQRPMWPPAAGGATAGGGQSPGTSPSPTPLRQASPQRAASAGAAPSSASAGGRAASAAAGRPTHQSLRRVKSEFDSERGDPLAAGPAPLQQQQPAPAPQVPAHGARSPALFERAASEPCEDLGRRGHFICGGPVTNVPPPAIGKAAAVYGHSLDSAQFRPITPVPASPAGRGPGGGGGAGGGGGGGGKAAFVSTLSRIHENLPANAAPPPASYDDYYDVAGRGPAGGMAGTTASLPSSPGSDALYTRALSSPLEDGARAAAARYPSHPALQLVSRRTQQFESGAPGEEEALCDRTQLYRSELARLSAKKSAPNVAVRRREFETRAGSGAGGGGRESRRPARESRSLESADPPSSAREDAPVKLRARSNSAESWAATGSAGSGGRAGRGPSDRSPLGSEPQRHKAVRQDSYLAAVRTPLGSTVPGTTSVPMPRTSDGQGSPGTTAVLRRQKTQQSPLAEEERIGRRVSYLKATWGDRMHVDSDFDLSDGESPHVHHRSGLSADRTDSPGPPEEPTAAAGAAGTTRRPSSASAPAPSATAPAPAAADVPLREGWLNCKMTLVDGKRAADRSWKPVWASLRGHTLSLQRERREASGPPAAPTASSAAASSSTSAAACAAAASQTPLSGNGDGEQLDTRGCRVDVAGDYTKKKHVLRLNTLSGSEVLLQAETADDMELWLGAVHQRADAYEEAGRKGGVAGELPPTPLSAPAPGAGPAGAGPGGARLSPLPAHKGIGIRNKFTSFRNRSPTGQSPVNKTRKPSQTDQLPSPKSKTWKGRVAKQLRKIQHGAGSPSSPTAPHPEGCTIGVPLELCPPSNFSTFVPLLVELCTTVVDSRGLDIVGIYRVPGNTAAVSALTESVNKGFEATSLQDPRWNDVNVISSLLKLFFRRLPNALLTSELYPLFIDADKAEDPNERILTIKKLVHELPEHHFETLRYLLFHLKKVVEHCDSNKMEARNLAIVFGPTLVRTSDDNMVTMVTDMSHQCRIVESLISHVDWFFSDEEDAPCNFPFNNPQDVQELEASSTNHNLLLSNIQKVEGMKADSANRDISAKDIVSSIISAANRKMQKAKSRKGGTLVVSATQEESHEVLAEPVESEPKQVSESKPKLREPEPLAPVATAESDESLHQPSSAVASSIRESVLLSGSIVKSLHSGREEGGLEDEACPEDSSPREPSPGATQDANSGGPSIRRYVAGVPLAGDDAATIRTYTGLSATTQERIRRFELETKAMLQRDQSRHRQELERREAEKRRIEQEWQQAKRDLESEDLLDKLADNPADLSRKGDSVSRMPALLKPAPGNAQLQTPTLSGGQGTSGPPSPAAALLTRTLQQYQQQHAEPPPTRDVLSGSDERDGSSSLQSFTHTRKVGGTHFFPSSPGPKTSQPTALSSMAAVSTLVDAGYPPTAKSVARSVELAAARSAQASMRNSVHSPSGQPRASELEENPTKPSQVTTADSKSSTALSSSSQLKRLKTGNEQGPTPSQTYGSLRSGSLDSLQEAYTSDPATRPQSDVSEDGGDLLASLTSTFDRKLKSLLTTSVSEAASPSDTVAETSLDTEPLLRHEVPPAQDPLQQERASPASAPSQSVALKVSEANESETEFCSPKDKAALEDTGAPSEDLTGSKRSSPSLPPASAPSAPRRMAALERQSRVEQHLDAIDNKLKELQNCRSEEREDLQKKVKESASLNEKEEKSVEDKETASSKLKRSESLSKAEKSESTVNTRLKRSESLTKAEREDLGFSTSRLKRSESLTKAEKVSSSSTKLRRSESLTKAERSESPSNMKLKRSDSLTKTEKTESNNSKRKQDLLLSSGMGRASNRGCNKEKENMAINLTKLKRKNGMPERSIKRRHTVGGTKDFDKLNWLDNRRQHQLEENEALATNAPVSNKERQCLRTSSPDLSSSRLGNTIMGHERFLIEIRMLSRGGGVMSELRHNIAHPPSSGMGRPHSLPDPNLASRVFKVPLESHV